MHFCLADITISDQLSLGDARVYDKEYEHTVVLEYTTDGTHFRVHKEPGGAHGYKAHPVWSNDFDRELHARLMEDLEEWD